MRFLLDTHAFLWFIVGSDSLSDNIKVDHLSRLATLPFHHRDPFDRLIVAQAISEKLPVVSIDAAFDAYGPTRLW